MHPDFFSEVRPTVGMQVLAGYKVWSAYKDLGSAEGAVMLHVASVKDIPQEFDLQMRRLCEKGQGALGVQAPSTWFLKWYLPYSGQPKF